MRLRKVLGNQIKQLGSDNNEERLTFDFPADSRPTDAQIKEIEQLVRKYITLDAYRHYLIMTTDEEKNGRNYDLRRNLNIWIQRRVRIVKFDDITSDLCGGTHLSHTAKLENFKITNVEKKAAGIFRIRIISSKELVDQYLDEEIDKLLIEVEKLILRNQKINPEYNFEYLLQEDKEMSIEILKSSLELIRKDFIKFTKEKESSFEFNYQNIEFLDIKDQKVYYKNDLPKENIKTIASTLREKYPNVIIILTSTNPNPMLVVASKNLNSNLIAQQIYHKFNGKGGGNAILSMGKIEQNNIFDFIINELKWEN
ncbi:DHHA1 domain-containing protein [Mycoplasmopsis cynos]|uniref:DHHA1 domain-containing protein n=1 Tax=Mycoplasmopsis cynos TaxID=171284 RepID=UPI003A5C792A